MIRLDKYLCDTGVTSRSTAKKLIQGGHVSVNGCIEKHPETKVSDEDQICLDHVPIAAQGMLYYLFHKPTGCVCANSDPKSATVFDYVPQSPKADLFTVGRLDKDTTGLLIITNDGDLAHRLLSPAHHVDKTYEVTTDKPVPDFAIEAFQSGLDIGEDKMTKPAELKIDPLDACHSFCTICEGMYHQVKRMYKSQGLEVVGLHRIRMGEFLLDETLKPGEYRTFNETEQKAVAKIKNR